MNSKFYFNVAQQTKGLYNTSFPFDATHTRTEENETEMENALLWSTLWPFYHRVNCIARGLCSLYNIN